MRGKVAKLLNRAFSTRRRRPAKKAWNELSHRERRKMSRSIKKTLSHEGL